MTIQPGELYRETTTERLLVTLDLGALKRIETLLMTTLNEPTVFIIDHEEVLWRYGSVDAINADATLPEVIHAIEIQCGSLFTPRSMMIRVYPTRVEVHALGDPADSHLLETLNRQVEQILKRKKHTVQMVLSGDALLVTITVGFAALAGWSAPLIAPPTVLRVDLVNLGKRLLPLALIILAHVVYKKHTQTRISTKFQSNLNSQMTEWTKIAALAAVISVVVAIVSLLMSVT